MPGYSAMIIVRSHKLDVCDSFLGILNVFAFEGI